MTAGKRTVCAPADARGRRLDRFLAQALPELSRTRIQALIDGGCVSRDGVPLSKPGERLKGGERFELTLSAPEEARAVPEELPLKILFEDRDLAVIDKAPGMVVHPGAGHKTGTLVNAALFRIRDLSGVGGVTRPGIVHRLDKGTSGCLVVAKNDEAHRSLQAAFKGRSVVKRYLALVHGAAPESGRRETLFGRHPVQRKKFTTRVREGKKAISEWRVLERLDGASLLEVTIETGRTHQIRVHLSEAGFPIVGDDLYGGARRGSSRVREAAATLGRIGLHAWKISFPHPRTGAASHFEAPVPQDLAWAIELLRESG